MLNRRSSRVVAGLVLASFAFGLVKLFELRYRSGQVYPAYSTLRADPKGCKALYESFASLPGYTVEQNLKPLHYLHATSNATIVLQGTSVLRLFNLVQHDLAPLTRLLANNNRIVLTFPPSQRTRGWSTTNEADAEDDDARRLLKKVRETRHQKERMRLRKWQGRDKEDPEETPGDEQLAEMPEGEVDPPEEGLDEELLQDEFIEEIQDFIDFGLIDFEPLPDYAEARRAQVLDPGLRHLGEHEIPWNSTMVFKQLDDSWQVLAERAGHPVILESDPAGTNGTIVVCSDSYFMSNESMLSNRRPALLLHLFGQHTRLIFDETHLGISRKPGIANLVRRYHLHGLVGGMVLLAGLFIWRNSTSLVPIESSAVQTHTIEGKDHAAGMINLLRRNIGGSRLFEVCLNTWLDQRLNSVHGRRRERVIQFAGDPAHKEAGKKQPLQSYRTFQREIHKRH